MAFAIPKPCEAYTASMNLSIFQVDAFSSELFAGNPAAIVPLEAWLPDSLLQAIAAENNLSETAFFVAAEEGLHLRWFTPRVEVALCGHATLATAHVLFSHLGYAGDQIHFNSHSGELIARRYGDRITLDFPATRAVAAECDARVVAAVGGQPDSAFVVGERDLMLVYTSQREVELLKPDFSALVAATPRCIIATAPGNEVDFVSRFFGPAVGVDEDPVTGSAHCSLTPYWSRRFGRDVMQARQLSARGGELRCELQGARVLLSGQCQTYLEGRITLPGAR